MLLGRLGQDPESKDYNGNMKTTFSLATNEKWKDKTTGEYKETTEWHNVVFWGRQAEVAQQYLKQGSLVFVEGSIQTRTWEDGEGEKKRFTDIRGMTLRMIDSAKNEVVETTEERDPVPF